MAAMGELAITRDMVTLVDIDVAELDLDDTGFDGFEHLFSSIQ